VDDGTDVEEDVAETPIPRKKRGRPPSTGKKAGSAKVGIAARKGRQKRTKIVEQESQDEEKEGSDEEFVAEGDDTEGNEDGNDKNDAKSPETNAKKGRSQSSSQEAEDEKSDGSSKSVYLDAAMWKGEREKLDDSFESAKAFFEKRGPWTLPSGLKPNKFKDVALGTLQKMGRYVGVAIIG
jgi:hypothetical protein